MLGSGSPVGFKDNEGSWTITVPRGRRSQGPATVVVLTLDRSAMALPAINSTNALDSLTEGMPVEVSSVWEGRPELAAKNITDGNEQTLWAASEKERSGFAIVDLRGEHTLNKVSFSDAPYRRTRGYTIELLTGDKWTKVGEGTETNFSGQEEVKLNGVKASKIRVTITSASDTPVIAEIRAQGR